MKLEKKPLSGSTQNYIPPLVSKLLERIAEEPFGQIALYGFSDAMMWLTRLLREQGRTPLLCDWRDRYIGYDCSGLRVGHIKDIHDRKDTLLVACPDDHSELMSGVRYLIDNRYDAIPVIYQLVEPHDPVSQESPFREIAARARSRAISMISDDKLFNLIQYVRLTSHLEGALVEFGTYKGGSAAFIVEAANHYGKKPIMIFDSYEGIPKSKYGLDHRWTSTFSNNSYAQVRDAFKDCENVSVIKGNVMETCAQVKGPVAFCHIAIDTLEASERLLNHIWPLVLPEGIVVVDDYGSFPNCVPLTVMTDKFCETRPEVFKYLTQWTGVFLMKRPKA